jgi:hypothetical protein
MDLGVNCASRDLCEDLNTVVQIMARIDDGGAFGWLIMDWAIIISC